MNAIIWAAREGISIDGATIYVHFRTMLVNVAKNLIASGIKKIIYEKAYEHTNSDVVSKFIKDNGVNNRTQSKETTKMEIIGLLIIIYHSYNVIIYDKYVQREHQLLINYPLIGRMRYVFEALREPLRQYFADENFYESKDKIDWVYNAAHDKVGFASFSPNQPQKNPKFLLKHANAPLNDNEVNQEFKNNFWREAKTSVYS